MCQLSLCNFLSVSYVDKTCFLFQVYYLDESFLGTLYESYLRRFYICFQVYCFDESYLRCFCLCFQVYCFDESYLRCFYSCFKCLEFLYKKIIILITNCPDNLNIYTTKYNLCIFENVRKPCSRDAFVKTMHHNFRKNITVCFDYLYWNIILLNSLRCIN